MRMMLSLKHIPDDIISSALSRIDPQDYDRKLREAINTKLASLDVDDAHLTEKVVRFCVQRGFDYEDIRRVIGSAD
jgi:SOS response regulatory protein OraA/RecX